jgi:hypothetical protein
LPDATAELLQNEHNTATKSPNSVRIPNATGASGFVLEVTVMAKLLTPADGTGLSAADLSQHRELLTLAIVLGCLGFWTLALWAVGAI